MKVDEIRNLFKLFYDNYDLESHRLLWARQSDIFRKFWDTKILGNQATSPEEDYDPIIKLIDVKARGFNKITDEAIARVNLPQGTWYRLFNDLRRDKGIRTILDKLFKENDENVQVELVNELEAANETNKNGLTGEKAAALNALIFLNDPDKHLSSVSLGDRSKIIEEFKLSNRSPYASFGEKVIFSNRDIITGFKKAYQIDTWPRALSNFLYSENVEHLWKSVRDEAVLPDYGTGEAIPESESEFGLEKHLEDFLITNWESTVFGQKYDLIEEDGELVSQQYITSIGRIDLLVRDKKDGAYVVIELKKSQASDDTVGQLARYIGWVGANLQGSKPVKGIAVSRLEDERLRYALKAIPNAEFYIYRISFSLEKR